MHGIPDDRVIDDGDIVSSTAARSSRAGTPTPRSRSRSARSTTSRSGCSRPPGPSLDAAIAQAVAGNRLGDIGAAVEGVASAAGFAVVREYVGHGIGTAMHEDPEVPNYGPAGPGDAPAGGHGAGDRADAQRRARATTRLLDDGWTVVTADGSPLRPLRAHRRHHRARPRGPDRSVSGRQNRRCSPTTARRPGWLAGTGSSVFFRSAECPFGAPWLPRVPALQVKVGLQL